MTALSAESAETLPCVPLKARRSPRYVGDHVIRHYRPLGLAALLRDVGADPATPEMEILGGIGRLVLRADGSETWEPTSPGDTRPPLPPPRPADPDLAAARHAACTACSAWRDARCTAAGCGCTGEGRPDIWSSRCPQGRWPAPTLPAESES